MAGASTLHPQPAQALRRRRFLSAPRATGGHPPLAVFKELGSGPSFLVRLFTAWLLAGVAAVQAESPPPIALGLSVLKVEARRVQGGYALGSAVVVAPGELVTNCHVTRESTQVSVLYTGLRLPVVGQVADLDHDLCLLRVPGLDARPVAMGDSHTLRPGDRVNAVGYTGGLALQATGGEVVALHPLDGGNVVQTTNWFTSGASGGGLFDEQQRLVGVLTFRLLRGESHYFAAPAEWVEALQRQAGVAVAPLDSRTPPFWQRPFEQLAPFLRTLKAAAGAVPDAPQVRPAIGSLH